MSRSNESAGERTFSVSRRTDRSQDWVAPWPIETDPEQGRLTVEQPCWFAKFGNVRVRQSDMMTRHVSPPSHSSDLARLRTGRAIPMFAPIMSKYPSCASRGHRPFSETVAAGVAGCAGNDDRRPQRSGSPAPSRQEGREDAAAEWPATWRQRPERPKAASRLLRHETAKAARRDRWGRSRSDRRHRQSGLRRVDRDGASAQSPAGRADNCYRTKR